MPSDVIADLDAAIESLRAAIALNPTGSRPPSVGRSLSRAIAKSRQ